MVHFIAKHRYSSYRDIKSTVGSLYTCSVLIIIQWLLSGIINIHVLAHIYTCICTTEAESAKEDALDCLYFTGNSLGLQPKCANELVQGEMDKWAKRVLEGRFAGKFPWYTIEDLVIEESARIVGGKPIEVTVMNTLTVNVHLSMVR